MTETHKNKKTLITRSLQIPRKLTLAALHCTSQDPSLKQAWKNSLNLNYYHENKNFMFTFYNKTQSARPASDNY